MKFLKLKDYEIIPCGEKHATHAIYDNAKGTKLTQEFCKKLCDEHDKGERYSKDSRYNYTTPYYTESEEIGAFALAAVQESIKRYYGNGIYFVYIRRK